MSDFSGDELDQLLMDEQSLNDIDNFIDEVSSIQETSNIAMEGNYG